MVRHGETGLIVPPFDPERDGASGYRYARPARAGDRLRGTRSRTIGRYTWPAVRDAWADVYQRRGGHGALDPWTTRAH